MYPELDLSTIYVFPQTTQPGTEAAYVPTDPIKMWADPNAIANADQDGNVSYLVLAQDKNGVQLNDAKGNPATRTMTIPATRAAKLNVFPSTPTHMPIVGTTPFPLDLSRIPVGYQIAYSQGLTPMSNGKVVLRDPILSANDPATFTVGIETQIQAIYDKVVGKATS